MNVDCRGVTRGYCNAPGCSCSSYAGSSSGGMKCDKCGHPPGKHAKSSMTSIPVTAAAVISDGGLFMDDSGSEDEATSQPVPEIRTISMSSYFQSGATEAGSRPSSLPATHPRSPTPKSLARDAWSDPRPKKPSLSQMPTCTHPNCSEPAFFDLNTGEESMCCEDHMYTASPVPMHTLPDDFNRSFFLTDSYSEQSTSLSPVQSLPPQFHTAPAVSRRYSNIPLPTPRHAFAQHIHPSQLPPFHPSQSAPNFQFPPSLPPKNQSPVPLLPDDQRCKYPLCNKKRYQEGSKTHECCGISHAREYEKLKGGASAIPEGMKCKTPSCTRPRRAHEDGSGHYYDYCGKSCRDGSFTKATSSASVEPCNFPGCKKRKYVDPANNRVHDYCGRTHANQAQSQGIAPQVCTLTLLSSSEVQAHFTQEWKKGTCPAITCILQISNTQLETRWNAYKNKLPRGYQMSEKHYHGTKLKCDIVNSSSSQPCTDKGCGICGIIKFGMYRECIRKNINFQRFGHGFYFAPNSSKCHDYTQGVVKHRAMLLVDILPGKKHVISTDDQNLTGPPDGCHSVYGKPGKSLNYAELVVYNPDCVMPRYIIVYVLNGVHKIAN